MDLGDIAIVVRLRTVHRCKRFGEQALCLGADVCARACTSPQSCPTGSACNLYGWYLLFTAHTELKNYLGREDINPVVELLLTFLCFPYSFIRLGKYLQEAQQRAGIASAERTAAYNRLVCSFMRALPWG